MSTVDTHSVVTSRLTITRRIGTNTASSTVEADERWPGGDRLGWNERRARNQVGGGRRIDSTHRGGRASDGRGGAGGRGRKKEGWETRMPRSFE